MADSSDKSRFSLGSIDMSHASRHKADETSAGKSGAEPSDQSLLRRFQRGSDDAATQIYLRYAGRIRALASARCAGELARRMDAEDVVQSVFRSFFQAAKRGHYDVPAGEELWKILLVTALNKMRSKRAFHRAAKRDVRLTPNGMEIQGAAHCSKQDDAHFHFLQMVVDEALQKMPAPHARMVELRIQGYQIAQIVEQTGRSKRSVERILQEARNLLKVALSEEE